MRASVATAALASAGQTRARWQVFSLYESGQSLTKIARRLKVDAGTVGCLLRKAGVSLRDCHGSGALNRRPEVRRLLGGRRQIAEYLACFPMFDQSDEGCPARRGI